MSCILYAWPSSPNLPSVSPACCQVEAYLRLAGVNFQIQPCTSAAKSPSGQLPALELEADVPGVERTEFGAARASIASAQSAIKDLDKLNLQGPQRAELLAWSSLVERLDVATEYSMWVEPKGFAQHSKATYHQQPFPLNWVLPLVARREVLRRHTHSNADALYSEACEAINALDSKLRNSGGPYLFGAKPCSLDALLFGHVLYYQASPSAAPALRDAVSSHPALVQFSNLILSQHFQSAVPTAQQDSAGGSEAAQTGSSSSGWSDAAKGQRKPAPTPEMTAVDKEFRRKSLWWLGGAAAIVVGYVLLSGTYGVEVGQLASILSSSQNEDDEEGAEEEEDEQEDRED